MRADAAASTGWAVLEAGLVAKVVVAVRAHHRWRRDGPSLRLLNLHWSREVDQHLTSVRPHQSRSICARDLPSLLKFPRLHSLDATKFVREYEATQRSSLRILSRLPDLRELTLASDNWKGIGVGALITLTGITSLRLETGAMSYVIERDLKILTRLPLTELSIRCSVHHMETFFRRCHGLERIEAQVPPGDVAFPYDPALLNGLEVMKLSFRPTGGSFELPDLRFLSAVVTLRELDISSFCAWNLEFVACLPKLHCLKTAVAAPGVLASDAFLSALPRLETFHLSSMASAQILQVGHVLHQGRELRDLSLSGCRVNGESMKDHLTRLERLSVYRCAFYNCQSLLSDLPQLSCLSYHRLEDPFVVLGLGATVLSRLKVLKLTVRSVDCISLIAKQTQLLSLGLRSFYPLSPLAMSELGRMPSLLELGVSPPFPESTLCSFLQSEVMQQLQVLYIPEDNPSRMSASLGLLRDREPLVRIELGSQVFEYFMRCFACQDCK